MSFTLGLMGVGFGHAGLRGAGSSGPAAPGILLSNNTVTNIASIGSLVGTLSTYNTTGTYTWSLTSNPGGLFSISGSNLNVAAALTAGLKPITVQASGGVPTPLTQAFNIIVSLFVPNNYSLTANMGSFVFTGESMTPITGYLLTADAGAFVLTGIGATLPGSLHSSQYTAFIARTSGLDAGHLAAYATLIDGLVTDGLWSKFDALWIMATDTAANARLNLVTIPSNPFRLDRCGRGTDVCVQSRLYRNVDDLPEHQLYAEHK